MNIHRFPNIRQMDLMDCGPTCLKMIAKYFGKYYSLQFLREKCNLTNDGVSLLDICHAAEQIGLYTISIKCNPAELHRKVPLPVILHWDNCHFVVLYKTKIQKRILSDGKSIDYGNQYYISDPSRGYTTYNEKEFTSKWLKDRENRGVLMAFQPQTYSPSI